MPRRGQGQQATRVASGQQYGQAQAQEQAQDMMPLPQMPQVRPGGMPLNRRSQRPNEPIMTSAQGVMPANKDSRMQQRHRAMRMLLYMEPLADQPGASPELRNTVRRLKRFVGNVSELVNETDPRLMVRKPEFLGEEP